MSSQEVISTPPTAPAALGWRAQAIAVVESLFPVTEVTAWDDLLALWSGLRAGTEWDRVLGQFSRCREVLEADHYLPFYRLRRLLESHLRLQATLPAGAAADLAVRPLRLRHFSWAQARRLAQQECFEHRLDIPRPEDVQVSVVEAV